EELVKTVIEESGVADVRADSKTHNYLFVRVQEDGSVTVNVRSFLRYGRVAAAIVMPYIPGRKAEELAEVIAPTLFRVEVTVKDPTKAAELRSVAEKLYREGKAEVRKKGGRLNLEARLTPQQTLIPTEATYRFKKEMDEFKQRGERRELMGEREMVGWSLLKVLDGFDVKPALYSVVVENVENWREEVVRVVLVPDRRDLLVRARLRRLKRWS
nr:hypothetical protein [Candidatus Freyrarchaeum guaymaensis]